MDSGELDQARRDLDEAWEAFHRMYAGAPGAEAHDGPDCFWYVSPIPFDVFAAVVRSGFAADRADARIAEVAARLAGTPHHWFVTPGSRPADLGARLERAGYARMGALGGRAIDLATLPDAERAPTPEGVSVRPVRPDDEAGVRAYARTYARLFGAPTTDGWLGALEDAEVRIAAASPEAPFRRWLAETEDGGVIAAAGVSLLGGGEASALQTLCTLAAWRGRGVGAALIARALGETRDRDGCRRAVLWSDPGAVGFYARLGFRPVGEGHLFAPL